MIRKIKNPSFILAIGYAIGQGSVLTLQLLSRQLGMYDVAGLIVLVVSAVSFCFQFSDMGNATYLVKNIVDGETSKINEFLFARAVMSFFICIIFSFVAWIQYPKIYMAPIYISIPFIGAVCSFFGTAYLEANKDYLRLSIFNCIPWLSLSLGLVFLFTSLNIIYVMFFVAVLIFIGCSFVCFSCRKVNGFYFGFKGISIASAFVLPQLGGQVLFRYILFTLASVASIKELGALGTVRYAQVGIILLLGFITRPIIRNYIDECSIEIKKYDYISLVIKYKLALYFSLCFSFLFFVIYLLNFKENLDRVMLVYWVPILFFMPLTIFSQAASQINQLTLLPRRQIFIEYVCLVVNISIFIFFVRESPVLAIVFSEAVHSIMMIFFSMMIKRWFK